MTRIFQWFFYVKDGSNVRLWHPCCVYISTQRQYTAVLKMCTLLKWLSLHYILGLYNCNFLVLLSTTICSQYINKRIVNIADENLSDYSFLSRNHYTKLKNYLKRRYRIRHWIPMFIGTPCTWSTIFVLAKFSKMRCTLCA